jgi:hypothetical protein
LCWRLTGQKGDDAALGDVGSAVAVAMQPLLAQHELQGCRSWNDVLPHDRLTTKALWVFVTHDHHIERRRTGADRLGELGSRGHRGWRLGRSGDRGWFRCFADQLDKVSGVINSIIPKATIGSVRMTI